jgi:hypothetical protein
MVGCPLFHRRKVGLFAAGCTCFCECLIEPLLRSSADALVGIDPCVPELVQRCAGGSGRRAGIGADFRGRQRLHDCHRLAGHRE